MMLALIVACLVVGFAGLIVTTVAKSDHQAVMGVTFMAVAFVALLALLVVVV